MEYSTVKLREVFFLLNSGWDEEKKELMKELQVQGIRCYNLKQIEDLQYQILKNENQSDKCGQSECTGKSDRERKTDWTKPVWRNRGSQKEILLITDDQSAAALCKGKIVCIGCEREGTSFFEGAELVTDELRTLDGQMLEETLCHVHGYPVTIAETERLIIREIAECDFEGLQKMSGQDGMQYAFAEFSGNENASGEGAMFDPERLTAYISHAYRFYGYGLWSVLKKDGTLIGCCGLSEFEKTECVDKAGAEFENAATNNTCLELQYMLAAEFQGQGYAQEMCRAALWYATERTNWDKVWIRVHRENEKSQRLARRLGFSQCGDENGEIIFC